MGSEMCIRDRAGSVSDRVSWPVTQAGRGPSNWGVSASSRGADGMGGGLCSVQASPRFSAIRRERRMPVGGT